VPRRVLALLIDPQRLRRARLTYRADELYEDLLNLSAALADPAADWPPPVKPPEAQPILTTTQFAASAHVDPETVRRACREGRIEATKRGRDWQIPPGELVRWMAAR
jgi:excisionase family DNA binding protein